MGAELSDLRRLKEWCDSGRGTAVTVAIERLVLRLGQVAVPLLGRELRGHDPKRRDAARGALMIAATSARTRVLTELRTIASAGADESKVAALGLLAELGERGTAQFTNPPAMQRRSALALAQQLESRSDVASAADLVVRQIRETDIFELLLAMREVAPDPAVWLADELVLRLDLDPAIRTRITELLADPSVASRTTAPTSPRARRPPRPT
ncbi:MAG: hypothetical protein H0T79_06935, partial [Deltaproteobacteria bacterium]|nr:hypothetical protein [Deltaproteobacteria bacterium]